MNLNGLLIGVSCFILIGLFHPIVIYTEYRFGKQLWPIFAVFGSTCITISFFLKDNTVSAIVSVLGFCLFWSIKELFEQEKRVQKGWYPKNPKKYFKHNIRTHIQISHHKQSLLLFYVIF